MPHDAAHCLLKMRKAFNCRMQLRRKQPNAHKSSRQYCRGDVSFRLFHGVAMQTEELELSIDGFDTENVEIKI